MTIRRLIKEVVIKDTDAAVSCTEYDPFSDVCLAQTGYIKERWVT